MRVEDVVYTHSPRYAGAQPRDAGVRHIAGGRVWPKSFGCPGQSLLWTGSRRGGSLRNADLNLSSKEGLVQEPMRLDGREDLGRSHGG